MRGVIGKSKRGELSLFPKEAGGVGFREAHGSSFYGILDVLLVPNQDLTRVGLLECFF